MPVPSKVGQKHKSTAYMTDYGTMVIKNMSYFMNTNLLLSDDNIQFYKNIIVICENSTST